MRPMDDVECLQVIKPVVEKQDEKNNFYYRACVVIGINVLLLLFVWQVIMVTGYLTNKIPIKVIILIILQLYH